MPIIYVAIVRYQEGQPITLCSYNTAKGNYPSLMEELIKRIHIQDQSVTYRYNQQYYFPMHKDGNLLFIALCDSSFKHKNAYAFLQEIKRKFKNTYTVQQIANAKLFGCLKFEKTLQAQTIIANNNKELDKRGQLKQQLTTLQKVMSENVDKVLQREQKVQIIVKRQVKQNSIAVGIKNDTQKNNRKPFSKTKKCKALVILGVLLLFVILIYYR